jgi:tetratricopeptide (TPR) repeat protein
MRRQVNFKLAAWLLAGTILLGGGVHLLHGFQVKRSAAALLRMAKRAGEQGQLSQELNYLNLYLVHAPRDPDALADYGGALERLGNATTAPKAAAKTLTAAFEKMDLAVGLAPERKDVRRRLVDLGMRIGRFRDANEHLKALLESSPGDAELKHLQGECLAELREFANAKAAYASAIKLAPAQVKSYVRLAWMLREQLNAPAGADKLMAELRGKNATSSDAWMASARYLLVFGGRETDKAVKDQKLTQAAQFSQKARALVADVKQDRQIKEAEILLVSADIARARERIDEARELLKEGVRVGPQYPRMYKALADIESQANRPEAAVEALRSGVRALAKATGAASTGRLELLWELAKLLTAQGDLQEADRLTPDLRNAKFPPPLLDYLAAWKEVKRERWARAVEALEKVQPFLVSWPNEQKHAHLLLGMCHNRLGDAARQYDAFKAAARLDGFSAAAHLGMGNAKAVMGKFEEAVVAYRKVPAGWREAGQLLIRLALRQPEKQRTWGRVEAYLADLPESPERVLVRADLLAAQDQLPQAYERLAKVREQYADHVAIWVALVAVAREQKQWDTALRQLDEAERHFAGRPKAHQELRLARVQYWGRRGGPEAAAALAKLVTAAEALKGEERQGLLQELAVAYAQAGDSAAAKRLYVRLAGLYPNDLPSRLILFDLAIQEKDAAAVTRVTEEIRRIEGDDGALWHYVKAVRLMAKAGAGADKKHLAEARQLLETVIRQRPFWPRALLALAQVKDAAGDYQAAVAKYQEAVELGVQNPWVLERVVELLHAQSRFPEAEAMLQKLRQRAPTLDSASRVAIDLAFQKRDYASALDLATQARLADSKDYRDHLRLGRLLEAAKRNPEAERAYRRAVELKGDAPEAWANLALHLIRTGAKQKAEESLREAEKKLPKGPALLALAYCYEELEQVGRAAELYRAALADRPDDMAVLRANILHALRVNRPEEAKPLLERMYAKGPPPEKTWANRLRAILKSTVDYEQARAALDLLGVGAGKQESADDLRAKAMILQLQQGPRHWRELVTVLENLARVGTLSGDERFLLAQRYEALGEKRKAREQMLTLLAEHTTNPDYLAYYADSLLRRNELAEASTWLSRLEALEPKTFRTLGIKALVLKAEKRTAEAVPFLTAFAQEQPKEILPVAGLLEGLGEFRAAEELFRKYVRQSEKPEAVLVLAQFLGRRQRTPEALDLCEGAWKTCPALAVTQACVYVFSKAPADKAQAERIERLLQAAVAKDPKAEKDPKAAVQRAVLGVFRSLQGRYADAEASFRQALAANGKNVDVLNNLAWLLSFRAGKGAEALALVDRAIKKAGPKPTLLDTRARIHRMMGNTDLALKDLDEAIAQAPSGVLYFHRALAYERQNRKAARAAWQEAVRLNLREEQVDRQERGDFARLRDALKQN